LDQASRQLLFLNDFFKHPLLTTVAIFASGSGSNAEQIIRRLAARPQVRCLVLSNRPDAYVLERAARLGVPARVFTREEFYQTGQVLAYLQAQAVDLVVLAGFLWLVPAPLVQAFPGRIVNIHPALLPRHGGKGMYGAKVHTAVLATGDRQSGITIHYVNEQYDEGQIIRQVACPVLPTDTPDTLAARVHELEYAHYPQVVEQLLAQLPG
jgi:phosphoribosylglycinamide formyltransferase-1